MKIASTADWHIGLRDLAMEARQLSALASEIAARGVDLMLHAGDVYHRPNVAYGGASVGDVQSVVFEAMRDIALAAVQWPIIVAGNHDYDPEHAPPQMLTVDEDTREARVIVRDGLAVIALPWAWNPARSAEAEIESLLPLLPPRGAGVARALLGHVQVPGARYNAGAARTHGACGAWELSRAFLESLDVDRVILGDFHARQPDLAGPGRGGYVGALMQGNHGEAGNPAGFEIWDTETGAVEWVELSEADRYETVEVRPGEPIPMARPGWRTRAQCVGWTPSRAECHAPEASGVRVQYAVEELERAARGGEIDAGAVAADPHAIIRLWAEHNGIDAERAAALIEAHDREEAAPAAAKPEPEPEAAPAIQTQTEEVPF